MLSVEDIFSHRNSREYTEVEVDGYGEVRIRSLTAGEKDSLERTVQDAKKPVRAALLQKSLVDADDNVMFTPKQIPELSKLPLKFTDPIFAACLDLNGLTKQDVEDMEGN
jgi:hypothetical protein